MELGAHTASTLTDLLGDTRARLISHIQSGMATAPELAAAMQMSPQGVRRHLTAMQADGLIDATTEHDGGMGRPADRWCLTGKGKRLFADRSAEFADQLLEHVEATYGRAAVAEFLKTRNSVQARRWADRLADIDDPGDRVKALADMLSQDGFAARVEAGDNGRSLTLLQSHCAIEGIAREHPEICAHESALFKEVLNVSDHTVRVSRRDTIASGSHACVCRIEIADSDPEGQTGCQPSGRKTTEDPATAHRSA